jgi:hypothetical protein
MHDAFTSYRKSSLAKIRRSRVTTSSLHSHAPRRGFDSTLAFVSEASSRRIEKVDCGKSTKVKNPLRKIMRTNPSRCVKGFTKWNNFRSPASTIQKADARKNKLHLSFSH